MIIYGGIDSNQMVIEDLYVLDLPSFTWQSIHPENNPGPLSHATLTGVFYEDCSEIFALPELWEFHRFSVGETANFGLYLFGGVDH